MHIFAFSMLKKHRLFNWNRAGYMISKKADLIQPAKKTLSKDYTE